MKASGGGWILSSSRYPGTGVRVYAPWRFAPFHHFLKHLPVSESIHRPPEAFILISHEMPAFDQAIERLEYELFARSDIIEDLVAKNEISTVDPNLGLLT